MRFLRLITTALAGVTGAAPLKYEKLEKRAKVSNFVVSESNSNNLDNEAGGAVV
jgi:hypothetical protein